MTDYTAGVSPKDMALFETKALVLFYQELFPTWQFPKHFLPVAQGLCDKRIRKIQIQIGPGAGKSQLLSCVYPTFTLGRDPTQTILGISGAEKLIQKFQKTSMGFIEHSHIFRKFFPDVYPDKKEGWSLEAGAYLTKRNRGIPDPNWFVAGINSASVVGAHASYLILDDIHNNENSSSEKQCENIVNLYFNTILGRAQSTGARFILAGRRWHENDLYGVLERAGDWVTLVLPAERAGSQELWVDVTVPADLECIYTELYPLIREDKKTGLRYYRAQYGVDPEGQGFFWPEMPAKREEFKAIKRTRPAVAESVYQCRPGARAGGVFLESDFQYIPQAPTRKEIEERNGYVLQAWDTASGTSADSDWSVGITAALFPCSEYHHGESIAEYGEVDEHMDVYILDVFREKLEFGDLSKAVRSLFQKWRPQRIVMEKKSSGIQIVQTLSKLGVPIEGINPGSEGKRARATGMGSGTGTGSVQGWFRLGRVLFPANAPWLPELRTEVLDFTGDGSGHDDQVDALVYLIATAIRMGGGFCMMPTGSDNETQTADDPFAVDNSPYTELNSLLKQHDDPYMSTCSKCSNLDTGDICIVHERKVLTLDSCPDFENEGDNTLIRWII